MTIWDWERIQSLRHDPSKRNEYEARLEQYLDEMSAKHDLELKFQKTIELEKENMKIMEIREKMKLP